jgi:hypothetical protein
MTYCKAGKSALGSSGKQGRINVFGQTPIGRDGGLRNSAPPKPAQRVGIGLKSPKGLA